MVTSWLQYWYWSHFFVWKMSSDRIKGSPDGIKRFLDGNIDSPDGIIPITDGNN